MAFDSKHAINHAIKYLTEAAQKRAAGGWIPPKEEERRKKEAAKHEEKQQKLLSKQFPTHYMPEVGRQVMQDGGTPEDQYDLGRQLQRGAQILGGTAQAQYERYGEPIVSGVRELMRPVQEGGGPESYQNQEMVNRAMDVVGGMGAGSLLAGPSAAQTNVLRSGMGPVAREVIAQPQRSLSPLGFYSAAAERASSLQPSGDAAQMIAALKNTQGLKTEELINAGLIDAAGNVHPEWAGRGKVTREDLVSHLQGQMPQVEETILGYKPKNEEMEKRMLEAYESGDHELLANLEAEQNRGINGGPKYAQYTLPGGENYREVLLKLPNEKLPDEVAAKKYYETWIRRGDDPSWENWSPEEKNYLLANLPEHTKYGPEKFKSAHWDDSNVLAHIRMADRTGPNGEKILHVEELQSDWGQKGKKEGFDTPEMRAKLLKELPEGYVVKPSDYQRTGGAEKYSVFDPNGVEVGTGYGRENAINSTLNDLNTQIRGTSASLVPSAPYVTSTEGWTDLALKRVLKEAAEGGYDKVVWTPGAEQAKRYDLSKHIDELHYAPSKDNKTVSIQAYKDNSNVLNKNNITWEEAANMVGKDMADKMFKKEKTGVDNMSGYNVLSGLDLQTGGEGMKGYYDSIVPKRLQNLAKKHDKNAKIELSDISGMSALHKDPSQMSDAELRYELSRNDSPNVMKMPSLTITPAMRESILRGQSAYQRGGAVNRHELAKAAHAGRNGDTMLAHINPQEAALLKRMGGSGTINPETGLPEFSGADPSGSSVTSSNFGGGDSGGRGGIGSDAVAGGTAGGRGDGGGNGGGGSDRGDGGVGIGGLMGGGGGGGRDTSIGGGGGAPSGIGGISGGFGSPSAMGSFGTPDQGQQSDATSAMSGGMSPNMALGSNIGSEMLGRAISGGKVGNSPFGDPSKGVSDYNSGVPSSMTISGNLGTNTTPETNAYLANAMERQMGQGTIGMSGMSAFGFGGINPQAGFGDQPSMVAGSDIGPGMTIGGSLGAAQVQAMRAGSPLASQNDPLGITQGIRMGQQLATPTNAARESNVPQATGMYGQPPMGTTTFGTGIRASGFPSDTGTQDPSQAAYAEQMAQTARQAYLDANFPESPRLGDLTQPTPAAPFATQDRAGSMGSMPFGTSKYGSDMTPMSSQPSFPHTQTPFSGYPADVQKAMIPNLPDSAFGRTMADPTGAQTQQALENIGTASDAVTMLNSPTLAGSLVRMFTPTPTPATPEQQAAIERMYRRDLGMEAPTNYQFGATPLAHPGQTADAYLSAGPSASIGRQDYGTSAPSVVGSGSPIDAYDRGASTSPRSDFNQAFAAARAEGKDVFSWTNPVTGKTSLYTTQLARKDGGRVPSLDNPDDWLAHIKVDTPKGKKREHHGSKPLPADYGHIAGTKGADGMDVDAFVGPNKKSQKAFVINQQHPETKKFDEHKVMLGFDNKDQAMDAYRKSYPTGLADRMARNIISAPAKDAIQWAKSGKTSQPVDKNTIVSRAVMLSSKKS